MPSSSSSFNSELSLFFRCHDKHKRLSDSEYVAVENLLFSQLSPTKQNISVFPRATPLKAIDSRLSSINELRGTISSSSHKSSKKHLEVFVDTEPDTLIQIQHSFDADSPKKSIQFSFGLSQPSMPLESTFSDSSKSKHISHETSDLKVSESTDTHTIPQSMTNAARHLLETINSNNEKVDSSSLAHESRNDLPQFYFHSSDTPEKFFSDPSNIDNQCTSKKLGISQHKQFSFDISDIEQKSSYLVRNHLPRFEFEF